ncbi:MAG: AMP-binding protein [Acidobacteriota bacterium]
MAASTLLESFAAAARERPEAPALHVAGRPLPWHQLWDGVRAFAGAAREHGVGPGDRVVLALPNGPEFFFAFFGAQLAGGVAVPLYPRSGAARLRDIAGFCDAPLVVVESHRKAEIAVAIPGARVVDVPELATRRSTFALPPVGPDDLALLQFTSGSTGDPKGVELTHRCLLTNVGQLIAGLAVTPRDVFVSWLPVCHDMGLVLMALVPLHLHAPLHLLPADQGGLRRWGEALESVRGTFTAAPDFAYRLLLGWARRRRPDLSSLRVALNAAEPVRSTTVEAFERLVGGGPVMTPGYGLAEATVGVSTGTPGERPPVDARGLVGVGRGLPDVELRVVGPGGAIAPRGTTGEIEVATPAASRGYFRNPAATAELFTADRFLRTGDLGYLDEHGELYVAGRAKSLISWGGLSIAPQEVEEAVDRLDFVRRSAAVGIDRERLEGEQVYVFAEVAKRSGSLADAAIAIVEAVHARMGWRPGRVYLVAPGAIPRTANGKVRHAALREDFVAGRLRREGLLLFPDY